MFFAILYGFLMSFQIPFSDGEPVVLIPGNKSILWVITVNDSGEQTLWRYDSGLQKVPIPQDTQYVVPHSERDELYIVGKKRVALRTYHGSTVKETLWFSGDLPIETLPRWQVGKAQLDRVILATTRSIVTIQDGKAAVFPHRLAADHKLMKQTEWIFPNFVEINGKIHWSDQHFLYSLSVNNKKEAYPQLGAMEKAIPVLFQTGTEWFFYGGDRGDLDSFGWRVGHLRGDGILTRFAQDPAHGRIYFTTISNKVRSHLYASVVRKRFFQVIALEKRGDQWYQVYEKEFGFKKGRGLLGVYWPGDWNGDGWLDMAICDKSSGLRVLLADRHHGFQSNPLKIGQQPRRFFPTRHHFFWLTKDEGSWVIKHSREVHR